MYKTVEEAAEAVDIMFAAAAIKVGGVLLFISWNQGEILMWSLGPAADDENDADSGDEDSDERRDGGRDEEDVINEEDVVCIMNSMRTPWFGEAYLSTAPRSTHISRGRCIGDVVHHREPRSIRRGRQRICERVSQDAVRHFFRLSESG
jgi:hypothetical protein